MCCKRGMFALFGCKDTHFIHITHNKQIKNTLFIHISNKESVQGVSGVAMPPVGRPAERATSEERARKERRSRARRLCRPSAAAAAVGGCGRVRRWRRLRLLAALGVSAVGGGCGGRRRLRRSAAAAAGGAPSASSFFLLPCRFWRLYCPALRAVVSRFVAPSRRLSPLRPRGAAPGRSAYGARPVARRCGRSGV